MIEMPIKLNLSERPMKPPPSPYGGCCNCRYVYNGAPLGQECPVCGFGRQGYNPWPRDELVELRREQVDMWNQRRIELSVIIAAMYFESSVFYLLYLGMAWFHPKLNRRDDDFEESQRKEEAIWERLGGIRTREATDNALAESFGHSGRAMLKTALGDKEADYYWDRYRELAEARNQIIHRGRRYTVRDEDGKVVWEESQVNEQFDWCLKWIPHCWVVFARLHNEYIHKPLWTRKGSGG